MFKSEILSLFLLPFTTGPFDVVIESTTDTNITVSVKKTKRTPKHLRKFYLYYKLTISAKDNTAFLMWTQRASPTQFPIRSRPGSIQWAFRLIIIFQIIGEKQRSGPEAKPYGLYQQVSDNFWPKEQNIMFSLKYPPLTVKYVFDRIRCFQNTWMLPDVVSSRHVLGYLLLNWYK